jgi:hypothetical protein
MGLFTKIKDYTKTDKSESINETIDISIEHVNGEYWDITIYKSKLSLVMNGFTSCISGTDDYLSIEDINGNIFIFGNQLLQGSSISILR